MAALNEFAARHGVDAVHDPLKRASLQRDLWAVFDWTTFHDDHPSERRALQESLAPIIREVFMRRIQGVSWRKLAAFLSESGVPTSFGVAKWSASATQYIVTNPVYQG